MTNPTNMKFCQSCGMPLTDEALFGANRDGSKNEDYCVYCYKKGAFVQECTMEEMIDSCASICVREGAYPDEKTAKAEMERFFPMLKRWSKAK